MKRYLADAATAIALGLLLWFVLAAVANDAAQAQVTDPAPPCDPWKTGQGVTFGQSGDLYAVSWWCPPSSTYQGWQEANAVVSVSGTDARQRVLEALNARDFASLLKSRTQNINHPDFQPLLTSMRPKKTAAKPPGPWFVAPNGSAAYRGGYELGEPPTLRAGERAPVGAACDCETFHVVSGGLTYCPVPSASTVSVCAKK